MASQITSIRTVCSAVCSGAHQRKYQSSVSRKMFPFDDVIMPCHDIAMYDDVTFDFRWYEYSSAPDDELRVEEALENIRFYFAHVMNGVRRLF